jgi:hypothetical protein
MNIVEGARGVTDRMTLADFVRSMREDLMANAEGWENPTLERFLDAFAGWCVDHPATNVDQPTWPLVAEMLAAATIYE